MGVFFYFYWENIETKDKSNVVMTKHWIMWKNIDKENHSEFACVVPEKQGYNHSSLTLSTQSINK